MCRLGSLPKGFSRGGEIEELWCKRCARRTENPEVLVRFQGAPHGNEGGNRTAAKSNSMDKTK